MAFSTTSSSTLKQYDGLKIALLIQNNGETSTIGGKASFDVDDCLGNVLRISLYDESNLEFVIAEAAWEGDVKAGPAGYDYCFCPSD